MIYPYIYPTVVIALIILILTFIMLRYTKFGRSIYAVGGNEQSALMMGLNVRRVKLKAYVLDGFLCGVGGILFCLEHPDGFVEQAKGFGMDAIASSVIGYTADWWCQQRDWNPVWCSHSRQPSKHSNYLPGNPVFLVDPLLQSGTSLLLHCVTVHSCHGEEEKLKFINY